MRVSVFIVMMLVLALPVFAQIDNGNITGRVTDVSGGVIVGAKVTVTQTEMNFETATTTNGEGLYRALNLRPGPYRVTVVADGFKKLVRESIELRIGQTLAVDGKLEVGALSDSIEVSAQAALLETETSSTGATLAGDYFYSLPNYQRHTQAVLFYTPGISFSSNAFTGSIGGMSVNGLSGNSIGVFEDGAIGTMGSRGSGFITETIANSIEDIKVLTTALPAEYGHAQGAVISVVKKSGTNQLHGTVAEQIRTRRMQHRRFFEMYRNSQVQPGWSKPPGLLVQNPDANLNGPVYIPKLYDGRNKTFFMIGWQMMIEKQTKQAMHTVPTPEMLSGDFSFAGSGVMPNPIFDPVSTRQVNGKWYRDAFPGNIVPMSRWSNVAKKIIAMKPLREPNVPGSWGNGGPSNNVMLGPLKVVKWDNYTGRLDHQFSQSLKAYATWTYNQRWERNPPYTIANSFFDFTMNKSITPRQHTASAGTTWIPTPTIVNDFRVTYYGQWRLTDSIAYNKDYAAAIGMGGMGLANTCMPGITTGFGSEGIQVGCGSKTVNETFTVKDDLSKALGSHSFKMGYELLRYRLNSSNPGNPDGSFGYASTGGITTTGGGVSNTGNNLAAFMVGAMSNFNFSIPLNSDLTRSWQHSLYLQDDWKVSPTLTVNLGLRWNVETPKTQKYGFISLFDLTIPDNGTYSNTRYQSYCPAGGCMGSFTHPKGADPYPMDLRRFDPNFGFAWHPLSRFVFRGGFRLAHSDLRTDGTSLIYTDEMMSNAYSQSQVSGNYQPLFMLDQGIPAWSYPAVRADGSVPYVTTNPGRSASIVSKNMRTPYVMTWNLGMQTELSKDYMLELRYDGSARAQGLASVDINTRPWGLITNPATGLTTNLEDPANAAYRLSWLNGGTSGYYRPYPNLGNINIVGNNGHLSHHAGLVRLEKRFSKGLNFQAFYQFQKTMSAGTGNPYLNWSLFRSRAGGDQTHNFTGTMNYQIPIGQGRALLNRGGWLNTLFGQFDFMWTYTIASGTPQGMSISGVSPRQDNYPGWMPTYGGVLLTKVPRLRDNWQDLGGDRFNQANQNSMIDCGPVVLNWGNDCFTYVRAFSRGNNGSNLWDMQRLVVGNLAVSKEVPIRERLRLMVRLDYQNPFKWYNWGGPNTGLNVQSIANSKTFGTNNGGGEIGTGTAGYGGTPLMNLSLAFKW